MKTQINQNLWGLKSVSFWGVLIIALGIIYIGIRFITHPEVGALGYGIPFNDTGDIAYGRIKGIRDISSGLVLLPLLWMRMRKAAVWVFTASIVVPACDFLIILSYRGVSAVPNLLIHGITAIVMLTISFLLFHGISKSNSK